MTDPLSVFLRDLPANTPRHGWVNHHDVYEKKLGLEKAMKENHALSPFLVFLEVPEKAFEEATIETGVFRLHDTLFTYSHHLRCLVLEIQSATHRAAREAATFLFDKKVDDMGLYSSLRRPGPIGRKYDDVSKQPDAQWMPTVSTEDPSKPTIFLEVGTSVSRARVESEAKRWLTYPNSPITMVILVMVHQHTEINMQVLGGYRKPQFSMAGQRMESTVIRSNSSTCVDGIVAIPFEFIFWRKKEKPKEHDVVFDEDDLSSFAESIWKTQGLI
ncbi:hypothetical protein PHISP_06185 [Aspergillus sp. HF37]|nr:hypothetical protein PHISP_06185 [Aspergillus sp. HF37]